MKSINTNLVENKIDVQFVQANGFYHVECDTNIKINKKYVAKGNRLIINSDNSLILAKFENNTLTEICEVNESDIILENIAI